MKNLFLFSVVLFLMLVGTQTSFAQTSKTNTSNAATTTNVAATTGGGLVQGKCVITDCDGNVVSECNDPDPANCSCSGWRQGIIDRFGAGSADANYMLNNHECTDIAAGRSQINFHTSPCMESWLIANNITDRNQILNLIVEREKNSKVWDVEHCLSKIEAAKSQSTMEIKKK